MAKVPPPHGKGEPPTLTGRVGNLDKPETEALVSLLLDRMSLPMVRARSQAWLNKAIPIDSQCGVIYHGRKDSKQ
jgi:hypothetical protein